jgi:hypothetical protein
MNVNDSLNKIEQLSFVNNQLSYHLSLTQKENNKIALKY